MTSQNSSRETNSRDREMLTDLRYLAEFLAIEAGKLVLKKWDSIQCYDTKGVRDVVTDADWESQRLITNKVRQLYPTHGFLTEEVDSELPDIRDVTWIVDPIDGTINYSLHQRTFCISIAVAVKETIRLGVCYDPINQEMFTAIDGQGFYIDGKPFKKPSVNKSLAESVVGTDWNHKDLVRLSTANTIVRTINRIRSLSITGSAALSLCWIASGRLDGYFNHYMEAWDIAAGYVILKEAGYETSHFSGLPWSWLSKDKTFLASNKTLHQPLLNLIAGH